MKTYLPDGSFMVEGHRYGTCIRCKQVIRVDKPLFGSMHVCLTDEEWEEEQRRRNAR